MTGTTSKGFTFELDDEVLDDYEILEKLQSITKGNEADIVDVAVMLLGHDQKERLKEHLRNEKGRVKASDMVTAIFEILNASTKSKN